MFTMIQKVLINGYEFSNVANTGNIPLVFTVEINSDRKSFLSTAKIKIANRLVRNAKDRISDVFSIGSPVEIWLGYGEYGLIKEFSGYVSSYIADFDCEITCEDTGYVFKRSQVKQPYTTYEGGVKLSELMENIYPATNKKTGEKAKYIIPDSDPNVGQWCVQRGAMVFDILDELKKTFSLYSYYRGDTLVVGGGVTDKDREAESNVIVDFQGNVPEGSSNLDVVLASNDSAIVKGQIQYRDNQGLVLYARYKPDSKTNEIEYLEELEEGMFGGIIGEINLGLQDPELAGSFSQPTLKEMLKRKLQAISFDGVFGDVTILGYPSVKHGDIATVVDKYRPEIEGEYKVSAVQKVFSTTAGYKQKLILAQRLSKK